MSDKQYRNYNDDVDEIIKILGVNDIKTNTDAALLVLGTVWLQTLVSGIEYGKISKQLAMKKSEITYKNVIEDLIKHANI